MPSIIQILFHLQLLLFLVYVMTSGYPLREPELKDETHFPNGTVIGKYTYMDNEGNPIYVKYFADDSSYGVELQSKKIIESNTEDTFQQQKNDIMKTLEPTFDSLELPKDANTEKNKYKEPVSKNRPKSVNSVKSRNDYEVFYQNNLMKPKQCGNDRVKIYLDKPRRIARDTLQNQAEKYCEQILN